MGTVQDSRKPYRAPSAGDSQGKRRGHIYHLYRRFNDPSFNNICLCRPHIRSSAFRWNSRRRRQNVYDYFESSFESITSFISQYADVSQFKSALADWIRDKFSFTGIIQFITTFAGSLISLFIGLVASIYLLKDKEFFLSLWQKFLSMILKQKVHGVTNEILGEINNVLTTFIKGALIDSLIVAFLSSLALSLVKVEYAVIIGIIGGLLNIIPYFGPFFGMVPAFLVALTTNGLGQAIIAVLALLGVQQIDSNYIYPKVVGSSTGLHPLFVLLSVSIFGYFGGIVGMLLAVPAAGIIQILIKKWAYR